MYATPIRRLMIGASHQFHNRLAESLEMIEEGSKKGSRGFSSVGVATSSLTGSDSCGDGVKPQAPHGDIPKEDTRGFIQDTQSDWTFNGRALDARQLPQTDRLMQERAKEVVQERARARQERAKQGGDGAAKCQAIGWCSHCHGLDFSNRSSGAPGKKTTFTPKYVPIPGEETADNIAAQAAALEQFQNRQHLHTPTHKASGGLMQKLGEAAIEF